MSRKGFQPPKIWGKKNPHYRGPQKSDDSTVAHFSRDNIMDDFITCSNHNTDEDVSTPSHIQDLLDRDFSAVSDCTNLCEVAMETNTTPEVISEIAQRLSEEPDKFLVKALRGCDQETIEETLLSWKGDIARSTAIRMGVDVNDINVSSGNEGGNAAVSDVIATTSDGRVAHVELKFGAHTNSASGMDRMKSILGGEEPFSVDKNVRQDIISMFVRGEDSDTIQNRLHEETMRYAQEFSSKDITVSSEELFDLIASSGAKGNSAQVDSYTMVELRRTDKKGATIHEIPLNITKDEQWSVSSSASKIGKGSRLNYIFVNETGDKTIRMTVNNKNTHYVKEEADNSFRTVSKVEKKRMEADGEGASVKAVPSYLLTGTTSYNVWYSEGVQI